MRKNGLNLATTIIRWMIRHENDLTNHRIVLICLSRFKQGI